MAIYHLSVKAVSRSAGRSSTAAAAYRAGCKIVDERTGEVHDYTRKGGVVSADVVLPDGAPVWANDRAALWNSAEKAEKRKDACVAREFEVALPHELPTEARRKLAMDFAKDMANREGCGVDVAIHEPNGEHDNLNHHAHILRTTRRIEANGLGAKLDTEQAGRNRKADLEAVRQRWAEMTNEALQRNGLSVRVDHRSLEAQGIDRAPTTHHGVAITGILRRGADSIVLDRVGQQLAARRAKALALEKEVYRLGNEVLFREVEIEEANKARPRLKQKLAEYRKQGVAVAAIVRPLDDYFDGLQYPAAEALQTPPEPLESPQEPVPQQHAPDAAGLFGGAVKLRQIEPEKAVDRRARDNDALEI